MKLLLIALAAARLLAATPEGPANLVNRPTPPLPAIPDSVARSLPADFLFGFASAATQVEGATNDGGKTDSIWDTFARLPGKIADGTTPDAAIDEYHRINETIQLLKLTGASTYRFSIAWTRLIPGGLAGSPVNQAAVEHYTMLLDQLLANGITPMVTLLHFDIPQVLEDTYKSVLNTDRFVDDFGYYAEQAFRLFGSRVKLWLTLNEPVTQCLAGFGTGQHAPGKCLNPLKCRLSFSPANIFRCAHSTLLAHAQAVKVYRARFQASQKGKISLANHLCWGEPFSNSTEDARAAQFFLDRGYGWFEDPLHTGDYPPSIRTGVTGFLVPHFTPEQSALLKGSADFVAINHYTTTIIAHQGFKKFDSDKGNLIMPFSQMHYRQNGMFIGFQGAPEWLYAVPWGLTKSLLYVKQRYNNPEVYITENGFSSMGENHLPRHLALQDASRVEYFRTYIDAMQDAIAAGVNVKGYVAWTLTDNWEWAVGFTQPFGVFQYDAGVRYMKDSAFYLAAYFGKAIAK